MSNSSTIARLEARLPIDIHKRLKRAAAIQGRTLTDFVVSSASDAANKVIEDAEILRISAQDQQKVAELLLNPPNPSPALERAAQRHHKNIDQL